MGYPHFTTGFSLVRREFFGVGRRPTTNGMASEWNYKNQKSSYRCKYQWIFDQEKLNLVPVNGELELTEFEFNHVKITEKWGKIQRKLDLVRVSGEFELSGFYFIFVPSSHGKNSILVNLALMYCRTLSLLKIKFQGTKFFTCTVVIKWLSYVTTIFLLI